MVVLLRGKMGRPVKVQVFLDLKTYNEVVTYKQTYRLPTDSISIQRIINEFFDKRELQEANVYRLQKIMERKDARIEELEYNTENPNIFKEVKKSVVKQ